MFPDRFSVITGSKPIVMSVNEGLVLVRQHSLEPNNFRSLQAKPEQLSPK